jgi:hypothetical protein
LRMGQPKQIRHHHPRADSVLGNESDSLRLRKTLPGVAFYPSTLKREAHTGDV